MKENVKEGDYYEKMESGVISADSTLSDWRMRKKGSIIFQGSTKQGLCVFILILCG